MLPTGNQAKKKKKTAKAKGAGGLARVILGYQKRAREEEGKT